MVNPKARYKNFPTTDFANQDNPFLQFRKFPKKFKRNFSKSLFFILFCFLGMVSSSDSLAQPPVESRVKAAFVFNFVKFVQWPETANQNNATVSIGVYGRGPMSVALRALSGKRVDNRTIVIKEILEPAQANNMHVLIFQNKSIEEIADLLKTIKDRPVLTVGETEGICERGGIIEFFEKRGKVRFRINIKQAKKVGIQISSKLLRLAEIGSGHR